MDNNTIISKGNISIAFFYGKVNVHQPKDYEIWQISFSFYGLKETPSAWYEVFDTSLRILGIERINLYFYMYMVKGKTDNQV